MNIHVIAQKLNISKRTIRFYEEKELISPTKHENNQYRTFTDEDIWRLQTIITLREIGFTISDIKLILGEIDTNQHHSLKHYLEIQRYSLYRTLLEYRQQISTTDQMITLLQHQDTVPLNEIFNLAEGAKRLREARSEWVDRWNYDTYATKHDHIVESSNSPYPNYHTILNTILNMTKPSPLELGLDLGTGTGNLAGKFLSNGYPIIAVDQSSEMLKQCKEKFPHLETMLGNLLAIPCQDHQFDYIVSSFALHHLNIKQIHIALSEMKRVLKPKGRICFADFIMESPFSAADTESAEFEYTDPYTYINEANHALVSMSTLQSWFEENDFIIKRHIFPNDIQIVMAVSIR